MRGRGYCQSPVGELMIESENERITAVTFFSGDRLPAIESAVVDQCVQELDEYFTEGRKFFTVELAPKGTSFQERVWTELLTIPYGKTISYLDLAIRLGDRNAIRAVGLANGQNPIAIIIPCHRVVGSNGDLTGYGGGLERKEWLLTHEQALPQLRLF